MPESIKAPELSESGVDEIILSEVVEEMLSEKGQDEILGTGFFWNAVHLYREKKRLKNLDEDRIIELKQQLTPALIKIFREKHRAFSGEAGAAEAKPVREIWPNDDASDQDEPVSRYMEAERRLEDLNESKRLSI